MLLSDIGNFIELDLRLFVAFVLSSIVYIYAGMEFHKGAWKAILSGRANMDVLVHIGTTTAMIWSSLSGICTVFTIFTFYLFIY